MAIYFFDKNQALIKIVPESATFEAIQTQELDDDSLLKDTLSVTVKGDEKLLNAEYMAVKSYTGNAQTFDMYRIVTDTTPDKSMSFTGMSLAPYELNGHILQDLRPANHSLSYTLNRVLDGTDWRVGYIEDGLSNVTTTFYYVSAKEALKELQSLVGCEFVFKVEISGQKITDKWIEVYKEMGNRTKKRFNYGTNALTVVRETNKADIYTALIGRGKGEEVSSGEDNESGQAGYGRKITFEDIEWSIAKGNPLDKPKGQYYLELPQATQAYGIKNIDGTMKARVGIVDFDDEEDKNRLINLTYQQLLVSSRPKVLFKTTVANVGATGIGDTVTIHRHDLGIHYQTRVRKIVRNKLNDNKTQIELGDAVVTASTKRDKQNNATIQNLNQEIEKVKADVTISQTSADGKNTIFYGPAEPTRKHTGDIWYRPHPSIAGETQMLVWNGTAWELVLDTSDLTSVSIAVEEAAEKADEAVQAAKDADARANSALEKAGANASLLTTHQNTINTINTTTLPAINSSVGDALANAKDAMDEAKKADQKIADYVTKNGLVSGTTVDTKINEATGEISKTIRAVESKIPTEIGARNYVINSNFASDFNNWHVNNSSYVSLNNKVVKASGIYGAGIFATINNTSETETYTISVYVKGTGSIRIGFESNIQIIQIPSNANFTRINFTTVRGASSTFILYTNTVDTVLEFKNIQIEKGTILTDWKLAPEDNYTQEEFKIFESTYNEDVKGINSSLTELSNSKVDGTTYTNFYNNEYKKTAQGVTDTYNKVNKIIDANGNSTDAFAKAVYDKNATRQSADFNEVTKDLVKEATYTAGINGLSGSISTISGQLDKLKAGGGGRNYALKSNAYYFTTDYKVAEYDLAKIPKGTKVKISLWGGLGTSARTFGAYINNGNGTTSGNSQIIELTKLDGVFGQGVSTSLAKWTGEATLNVDATKVLIFGLDNNSTSAKRVEYVKVETGETYTDWTIAPEDTLGKADFQVFQTTYEANDKAIKARLLAVDSGKEGSIAYRLNETEKTANGNTTTISDIKKTPEQQITGYQTIKERSELYERVIGKDEAGIKSNMARMVMTDSLFKTEVIKNVPSAIGGRNYVLKSNAYYYTNDYKVAEYDLSTIPKGTKIKISLWGGLGSTVRTFGVYVNNNSGVTSGDSQRVELTKLSGIYGQGVSVPLDKWTAEVTLNVDAKKILIYGLDNNSTSPKRIEYIQIETGDYYTDWTAAPEDKASMSDITQLSDNINLKVSKSDLISQINVQAGGVLITSGTNKLNITPETTYIQDATIKSAMIESLLADRITAGTLDASKVKVVNLDANNITANKTEFIKTNWNEATGGGVTITGGGVRAINSEGSRVTLENGVVSVGNRAGVNLGFFGDHVLNKSATGTMTITASLGTETAFISATSANGATYKRSMSIMAGAGEIDMFTALDMNKNSLKDVTDIGFTGGHIKGTISDSARYLTLDAGTGTAFDIAGVTRMSITSVVNVFSGIDMRGNDIASVGKLTYNSDQRLKTNIKDTNIRALDAIRNWKLVSYDWVESGEHVEIGLISQDSPEVMIYNVESDIYGIDAGKQTMINTLAIQQLDSKTDDEISQLKAQVASLQDELTLLKGA